MTTQQICLTGIALVALIFIGAGVSILWQAAAAPTFGAILHGGAESILGAWLLWAAVVRRRIT